MKGAGTMQSVFKLMAMAHVFVYRLTSGRVLGRMFGLDVLLLTTTGRKTGKVRTTPLLYVRDGERIALIASNGGSKNHPGWWLNLRDGEGQVQIGGETMRVTAEQATPEEKARLWPRFTARYAGYDAYQRRTKRDIPVVLLRRAGAE
jgi:deazaflavin-dependent oxidoreductase (nitroreductase family)